MVAVRAYYRKNNTPVWLRSGFFIPALLKNERSELHAGFERSLDHQRLSFMFVKYPAMYRLWNYKLE